MTHFFVPSAEMRAKLAEENRSFPNEHAHTFVHFIDSELRRTKRSRGWLISAAKLSKTAVRGWWDARRDNKPGIGQIDKALQTLGYHIVIRPISEPLLPEGSENAIELS